MTKQEFIDGKSFTVPTCKELDQGVFSFHGLSSSLGDKTTGRTFGTHIEENFFLVFSTIFSPKRAAKIYYPECILMKEATND